VDHEEKERRRRYSAQKTVTRSGMGMNLIGSIERAVGDGRLPRPDDVPRPLFPPLGRRHNSTPTTPRVGARLQVSRRKQTRREEGERVRWPRIVRRSCIRSLM